jgi:hypothetical protein
VSESLVTNLADAVAAELNAAPPGTFDLPLVAVRHYRPVFELVELKTLRVSVVPKKIEITGLSRTTNQHEVTIDVAVQKKVTEGDTAELDGLMSLVERVGDYLRLRRLSAMPTAIWSKTENAPVYSPEHLEQKQVFTSVLSVTFKVVK